MFPEYDVIVVGAGHSGCEAAVAAANLGSKIERQAVTDVGLPCARARLFTSSREKSIRPEGSHGGTRGGGIREG